MIDGADRDRLATAGRFGRKHLVTTGGGLAITSHPLVSRIAADTLRAGGNACDAVLTASAAQTVVEPHMSTITGVLSLLYFDAAESSYSYVNGSAAAPAGLTSFTAGEIAGGKGVAVPGWWAGFEAAARRHGTQGLEGLLAPAVDLARDGFPVYPFLFGELFGQAATVGRSPEGREMFFPDGTLLQPGDRLRQVRLAETLERLAQDGSEHFYRGDFARRLVDAVASIDGPLGRDDLDRYEPRWMEPARGTYRGYGIVASPPPDQGGSHLIEMLNLVELADLAALGHPTESADALALLVRVHQEVYTAGAQQRDPRSHHLPLDTILSKEWAALRFELMKMSKPLAPTPATPGSCQVTVVDADGNAATVLHSSMALPWVNGLFVDGVSVAAAGGHYLRALPKPGDRISSIVAPNMITVDGRPFLVSGSPSQSLLANILQNVVNVIDYGMDLERSIHLPRFGGVNLSAFLGGSGPAATMVEADIDEGVREAVAGRGLALETVSPWYFLCGSFEGIRIDPESGERSACGDPRRYSVPEAA